MVKKIIEQNLADEFVGIFNELDARLRKASGMGETVSHMFIIDRLSERDQVIRRYKEEMKLYARLRNAIVHNPFGGKVEVIADPHPEVVKKYRELKDKILNPPPALSVAIKPQRIYSTTMDASAREVMQVMADRMFTYVPVLDKEGHIAGIFSENTVFLYLTRNEICAVDSKTAISEFAEYLPVDRHVSEYFEFVPRAVSVDDVRDRFEEGLVERKRLAAVFITETGRRDEAILGMITAWDIAGNNK
jgi:CBS domain-containing protein